MALNEKKLRLLFRYIFGGLDRWVNEKGRRSSKKIKRVLIIKNEEKNDEACRRGVKTTLTQRRRQKWQRNWRRIFFKPS